MNQFTKVVMVLTVGVSTGLVQAETIYCVHDDKLNDSQFCHILIPPAAFVVPDFPIYEDCDIEALDNRRFEPGGTYLDDRLYAASGDDTPRPGHLYYVQYVSSILPLPSPPAIPFLDPFIPNGPHATPASATPFSWWVNLIDLGDVDDVTPPVTAELREIDAISFHPVTGDLWGWAQGEGLFVISPFPFPIPNPPLGPFPPVAPLLAPIFPAPYPIMPPLVAPGSGGWIPKVPLKALKAKCLPPTLEVPIIKAELIFQSPPIEMEDLTWNWEGKLLYGVENVHDDPVDSHGEEEDGWPRVGYDFDFDKGITLWVCDPNQQSICAPICPNMAQIVAEKFQGMLAEIEGLEALPEDLLLKYLIDFSIINPATQDLLVVGLHGPHQVLYAAIITPPTSPWPPTEDCQLWQWLEHETMTELNDIEGLAFSLFNLPLNGND
jgi:hypothetical protein